MKDLLARHAGLSTLKQLALEDAVGKAGGWGIDMEKGLIWFDEGPRHPIQILGTEGYGEGTWLWAWANAASNLPPEIVRASERLRAIGKERNLPVLVTDRMPLSEVDGHRISAIACGLLEGGSYWRGEYKGGAAFFLLTDFPSRTQMDRSSPRVWRAIHQAIETWELDARPVIAGLAADLHYQLTERPGTLTLVTDDGSKIDFHLDAQGRIVKEAGTFKPPRGAKK